MQTRSVFCVTSRLTWVCSACSAINQCLCLLIFLLCQKRAAWRGDIANPDQSPSLGVAWSGPATFAKSGHFWYAGSLFMVLTIWNIAYSLYWVTILLFSINPILFEPLLRLFSTATALTCRVLSTATPLTCNSSTLAAKTLFFVTLFNLLF